METIVGVKGVDSVAVDMKEGKITVIGDADPVLVASKIRKRTFVELVSVGPAKPEKFEAKRAEKKEGSNWDTENRGANHYLGVQRAEAVGGFGGMNPAIEDNEGSKTRIVEAVARFGDFSSIQVDIKKGMVTVVGKSVPVRVALKVREMGYRAKLLSLGPATEEEDPDEEDNEEDHDHEDNEEDPEEEDPDEEDNEDLDPNHPSTTRNERYPCTYPRDRRDDEDSTTPCTVE